jgi:hypothetical protein
MITGPCASFRAAVQQAALTDTAQDTLFLSTYFHTNELLDRGCLERFGVNLSTLFAVMKRAGYTTQPTTLTSAAALAKQKLLEKGMHHDRMSSTDCVRAAGCGDGYARRT